MSAPAFQFYPNDFLGSGSVAAMTLEEVGAYWVLLCYEWNEDGLPDDFDRLARWCRVSRKRFDALWSVVGENFTLQEDRWINERLERERIKQSENRAKRKRAAEVRWGTGTDVSTSNADAPAGDDAHACDVQCPPSSTPISSPSPTAVIKQPVAARPRGEPAPWMGKVKAMWDAHYPAAAPPPGTAKALRPLFNRLPEDAALHAFDVYLRETPSQYLNFGKFAATAGVEPKSAAAPVGRLTPAEQTRATIAKMLEDVA